MATFTISKVDFANPTGVMQTFSFDYKLWSDPDTNWINIATSSTVNTDGTLVTPLTVTGLAPNTLYYIRAANTCNSPLEYFAREITTDNTVTTFWTPVTNYAFFSTGMTINVYATFFNTSTAPIDIENYNTAYFWLQKPGGGTIAYGNPNVAWATAPNWISYPGNPLAAIIDWLTSIFSSLTGDVSEDYEDVFNENTFGYSVAIVPSGTWSGATGQASVEAAGSYNYGDLNLVTNNIWLTFIKFSKTE